METQKGPYKDYCPFKRGLYIGFVYSCIVPLKGGPLFVRVVSVVAWRQGLSSFCFSAEATDGSEDDL